MRTGYVYDWSIPEIALANGDKLIWFTDDHGETITYMPVRDMVYYRWLCGNEFVWRSKRLDGRIGEAVRVVIPDDIAAALPTAIISVTADEFPGA
jgi:hypothetical protein